jgi:hypothetical protein
MSRVRVGLKLQYLGQFGREALLPVQYNEILQRRTALDGERRLMFAVLDDAVECYLRNMSGQSRQLRLPFYEVQHWLNVKNRVGLFSYETICEELGIDAKTLRAALEGRLIRRQRIGEVVSNEKLNPNVTMLQPVKNWHLRRCYRPSGRAENTARSCPMRGEFGVRCSTSISFQGFSAGTCRRRCLPILTLMRQQ